MRCDAKISITTQYDLFPVELFDQQFRRIERGYGRLEAEVKPGLYLARCEVGGPAIERVVKVVSEQTVPVHFSQPDIMPSPSPVAGSVSRHQFYTDPVWRLTQLIASGAPVSAE